MEDKQTEKMELIHRLSERKGYDRRNIRQEMKMDTLQKLTRPLDSDDIELRVGHFIGTSGFVELLAYKTARTDSKRLDEVFPFLWRNRFERDSKGRLFCTIGIWFEGVGWVERSDTGVESFSDGEKGEASDAFKRAGFKWGIGAELYSLPKIKINLKSNEFKLDKGKDGKARAVQTFDLKLNEWTVKNDNGRIIITDETGFVRFDSGKKYNPKPTETKQEAETEPTDTKTAGRTITDSDIKKARELAGLKPDWIVKTVKTQFAKEYKDLTPVEKASLLKLIEKELNK
jgi:hypothetical protein